MADFTFFCSWCGGKIAADTSQIGVTAECPHCQRLIEIKAAEPQKQSAAPEPPVFNKNLIQCPACGNMIWKGANVCPKCGKKKELSASTVAIALISTVLVIVLYASCSYQRQQMQYEADLAEQNRKSLQETIERNREKREEEMRTLRQLEYLNNK
jgi:DNA-directed RNA polymerase subunit M/transcription elongation factor TFIIS